jgi:hypothetical protein
VFCSWCELSLLLFPIRLFPHKLRRVFSPHGIISVFLFKTNHFAFLPMCLKLGENWRTLPSVRNQHGHSCPILYAVTCAFTRGFSSCLKPHQPQSPQPWKFSLGFTAFCVHPRSLALAFHLHFFRFLFLWDRSFFHPNKNFGYFCLCKDNLPSFVNITLLFLGCFFLFLVNYCCEEMWA